MGGGGAVQCEHSLRNHAANRHNYRSRQFLKAIVQVEVEAIAEVIAWSVDGLELRG